jgi:hypothetical protein
LRTLTNFSPMLIDSLFHHFRIRLFLQNNNHIFLIFFIAINYLLLISLNDLFFFILIPRVFRFKLPLLLYLVYYIISIHLHLFQNIILIGLRLELYCLINHLSKLSISLIQLFISNQQRLISRSIWFIFAFQFKNLILQLIVFPIKLQLITPKFPIRLYQLLLHLLLTLHLKPQLPILLLQNLILFIYITAMINQFPYLFLQLTYLYIPIIAQLLGLRLLLQLEISLGEEISICKFKFR